MRYAVGNAPYLYLVQKLPVEQLEELGEALLEIFQNYNDKFESSNNNKFNKNVVLFEIREMTNLSTKEIRNSLRRYKKIYQEIVNDFLK